MTLIGGKRIPLLVQQPLEPAGVRVPGPDVLGLQVFQLGVNVVPFRHDCLLASCRSRG